MNSLRHPRRLALAGVVLLLLVGAALWYWRFWPDPKVAQARELAKQLADSSLPAEKRRELGKQLREEVRQLSPDQRREVFKDRRKAMQDRIAGYFKKSRAEQIAQLDQDINRMEDLRRQRPQQGQPNAANAWNTSSSGDRDLRRRERLDQSTPEERAQRAEYFKQLNDRRRQRGLGPLGRG